MSDTPAPRREPRWPAMMAVFSVGGLYWALPEALSPGPGWLALALAAPLSIVSMVLYRRSKHGLNQIVGYAVLCVITAAVISALALLIVALLDHKEPAPLLLRSAAALWISNILVFASWYWRLDAGGPDHAWPYCVGNLYDVPLLSFHGLTSRITSARFWDWRF